MSQFTFDAMANREARIESLRRQIAAGTYRVNTQALASVLMEHMQQKSMRRAA